VLRALRSGAPEDDGGAEVRVISADATAPTLSASPTPRERPILFSAPMIRALLAGQKTQTRRIVRPNAWTLGVGLDLSGTIERCPYGAPGDRLWVREAWRYFGGIEYLYQREPGCVEYRADGTDRCSETWRPSIHMERLQQISADDILAEGIRTENASEIGGYAVHDPARLRELWIEGWDRINSKRAPWKADPWVWVVTFSVVKGAR
jgi:hypothetical protein